MLKGAMKKKSKTNFHSLAGVWGEAEKRFGKGIVMNLDQTVSEKAPSIPTGSLGLDEALGIGGIAQGRVVEIYGPESSGKTTLTLHIIAEALKLGGGAAFIDAEHAMDTGYARALGVDFSRVVVSQPDCGEQALQLAEMCVRSDDISVVVIDSVAALTPRAEIEGEVGDHHVGLQARMMSQACRKIASAANQHNTTVIFINQLRQKIGVTFGSGETTTGGNALKFYASMRLDIRRIATLKGGDGEAYGNRVRVKVAKNKCAAPFKKAEFEIIYGKGICQAGEVIDMALAQGLIQKSGAWYSYGERRLGQGREKVRDILENEPEVMSELRDALLGKGKAKPEAKALPVASSKALAAPKAA